MVFGICPDEDGNKCIFCILLPRDRQPGRKRDGTKFVPVSRRPGTGRDGLTLSRDGTGRDDLKIIRDGTGRDDLKIFRPGTGRDGTTSKSAGTGPGRDDLLSRHIRPYHNRCPPAEAIFRGFQVASIHHGVSLLNTFTRFFQIPHFRGASIV